MADTNQLQQLIGVIKGAVQEEMKSYCAKNFPPNAVALATTTPGLPAPMPQPTTPQPTTPQPTTPQPGGCCGTTPAKKDCCSNCKNNTGQCSCSAESLGCATGDTVNPKPIYPNMPAGYSNCVTDNGKLAPCDADRIMRTKRRFSVQGLTADGSLVVSANLAAELDTVAAHSWFAVNVDEIGLSHQICPRDFTLILIDAQGGETDVSDTIVDVAVQDEGLYENGSGSYVSAWNYPKPADPDDLKITDGRCACERLCVCQRPDYRVRIAVQAPDLAVDTNYRLVVKGVRDCWLLQCGTCPPPELCNREESVA